MYVYCTGPKVIIGGAERGINEEVPSAPLVVIWHVTGAGENVILLRGCSGEGEMVPLRSLENVYKKEQCGR